MRSVWLGITSSFTSAKGLIATALTMVALVNAGSAYFNVTLAEFIAPVIDFYRGTIHAFIDMVFATFFPSLRLPALAKDGLVLYFVVGSAVWARFSAWAPAVTWRGVFLGVIDRMLISRKARPIAVQKGSLFPTKKTFDLGRFLKYRFMGALWPLHVDQLLQLPRVRVGHQGEHIRLRKKSGAGLRPAGAPEAGFAYDDRIVLLTNVVVILIVAAGVLSVLMVSAYTVPIQQ